MIKQTNKIKTFFLDDSEYSDLKVNKFLEIYEILDIQTTKNAIVIIYREYDE